MSTADRLRFWGHLFWTGLKAQAAYKTAFSLTILAMVVNDGIWLLFWWLFFRRFPVLKGWEGQDIIMLWAVVTLAYGIVFGLMGNLLRLADLIIKGDLDLYLALPKPALPHLLLSTVAVSNLGDIVFGTAVFFVLGDPSPTRFLLYVLAALLGAMILFGFALIFHSLAFFVGRADTLAGQAVQSFVSFSSYPGPIFEGALKILLFTALPAGFIDTMPVAVIRQPSLPFIGEALLAGGLLTGLGLFLWKKGLKRYESGNLMGARI